MQVQPRAEREGECDYQALKDLKSEFESWLSLSQRADTLSDIELIHHRVRSGAQLMRTHACRFFTSWHRMLGCRAKDS